MKYSPLQRAFTLKPLALLLLLLCINNTTAQAQDKNPKPDPIPTKQLPIKDKVAPDTADYPYWIKMMEDTMVNFYQAEKAFNAYWKNRVRPATDDNESYNPNKRDEDEDEEAEATANINIEYVYDYKRFKAWEQSVKNFVMDDGHIMYPQQRVRIYQQLKNQQ